MANQTNAKTTANKSGKTYDNSNQVAVFINVPDADSIKAGFINILSKEIHEDFAEYFADVKFTMPSVSPEGKLSLRVLLHDEMIGFYNVHAVTLDELKAAKLSNSIGYSINGSTRPATEAEKAAAW